MAKSPDAGQKLEMAAMHMSGTAEVLAKGITSSKGISGNVTGAGSSLRAALTGLLIQHVAATGFVVQTAVAAKGNLNNSEVKGAVSALSDNTNQLGTAIGSVYGPAAQQQFLKLWRAHIGFFVNYTLGVATKDHAKVTTAKKDLAGYINQFAAFVSGATKLPKAAVAADLQGHVSTLETAINSIVAGSPKAGADLLAAEEPHGRNRGRPGPGHRCVDAIEVQLLAHVPIRARAPARIGARQRGTACPQPPTRGLAWHLMSPKITRPGDPGSGTG